MLPICHEYTNSHTKLSYIFALLQDGTYLQKLISPNNDGGTKRTVQDLLDDFSTSTHRAGKPTQFHHVLVDRFIGVGSRMHHDFGTLLCSIFLSIYGFLCAEKKKLWQKEKCDCVALLWWFAVMLLWYVREVGRNTIGAIHMKNDRVEWNSIIYGGTNMVRRLCICIFCAIAFICRNKPWRPLCVFLICVVFSSFFANNCRGKHITATRMYVSCADLAETKHSARN